MSTATAPQPTRYGTHWHLPARKPTIAQALRLLELPTKPRSRRHLRERMEGWRHGSEGPWGCSIATTEEAKAWHECHDAYIWLRAQLPAEVA